MSYIYAQDFSPEIAQHHSNYYYVGYVQKLATAGQLYQFRGISEILHGSQWTVYTVTDVQMVQL